MILDSSLGHNLYQNRVSTMGPVQSKTKCKTLFVILSSTFRQDHRKHLSLLHSECVNLSFSTTEHSSVMSLVVLEELQEPL